MEAYLFDWLNLLLRWLHVITAIAWIGASFYFVMLDNSLTPPEDEDLLARGVNGELWAVHGGGFYNSQKYFVGPKKMPKGNLHWSYWESYSTWLSGFALFTVMYLWQAQTFLVDPRVFEWSQGGAIAAALGFLVAGWIVYDLICRVFGRNKDGSIGGDLRVGVLIFIYVCAATWLACHLFAGRAAFLLMGAMLGTIMSANVFFWIIPGQRNVVADLKAGRQPDPIHGQRGKQRSVHNTYFTLPVLIAMISNHYGMLYLHEHNWIVLIGMMLVGALVRQFFVLRHRHKERWELVIVAIGLLVGLVFFVAPERSPLPPPGTAQPGTPPLQGFARVEQIVTQRCAMCHNAALASKGVALHTADLIVQHAAQIHQQAVVSKQMPLNNATGITAEERELLGKWFDAGAKRD
ncbi:urate hydroxylase PuuD [Aquincola tertiaricarbonis]|uniref:urate hydroxylase PuuD n=1 Tax=Aquincola tertiaricarbonis TaxID=391953 RepID=UPI00061529C5|nr:urate hydroxylase PuuD [Aquincola tertiaricarbonis]